MIFEQIKTGGDRNFSYLVGEKNGQGLVIDPVYDVSLIDNVIGENNIEIKYVVNTHLHGDHTNGNDHYLSKGAKQIAFGMGAEDGMVIELGGVKAKIILTPGHTDDSLCVLINDTYLCTGDTLFVGKVGGTHGEEAARNEAERLNKILSLDGSTMVFPGHDYGTSPVSTIENENRTNPFVLHLKEGFEKFTWLKENWATYKVENNIK